MNELTAIILRIVCGLLAILGGYILTKAGAYFDAKKAAGENTATDDLISSFVAAADQMLKTDDPSGEKRLDYVQSNLEQAGIIVNEIVQAKIQAEVQYLNLAQKSAKATK